MHTVGAPMVATAGGRGAGMRVAIALGGTALLTRGEPTSAEAQRDHVRAAAPALAAVAWKHQLVLSHGNGPQVGLLAPQAAAGPDVAADPLDALGAGTEQMMGYILEQELGNLLPVEVPFATLLTMVAVDPDDPAFDDPDEFVGPGYDRADAERLAAERGWAVKRDGDRWRRVVPSPEPERIFEIRPIRWLLDKGAVVICAGGGGVPTMYVPGVERTLVAVEAVLDKDLVSELLARQVGADLLVMVTDVDGVYAGWGTPGQRRLDHVTPDGLRDGSYAAGSMGPKVEAAIRFVEATGKRAAIGGLTEIEEIVEGTAGTQVVPAAAGTTRTEMS